MGGEIFLALTAAAAAAIVNAATSILSNEEARDKTLVIILIPIVALLLVITLIFYLLTLPFGWLAGMFLGDEYDLITSLRDDVGYAAVDEPYYDYMDGFNTYGGLFTMPCEGFNITNPYGYWFNPFVGKVVLHRGIDMQPAHHSEIMAVYGGEVVRVSYGGDGYGQYVQIRHELNGVILYTLYAHLSQIDVEVGDEVEQGDVIGLEGGGDTDPNPGDSTGHHLHFEVRKGFEYGTDVDPYPYLFAK